MGKSTVNSHFQLNYQRVGGFQRCSRLPSSRKASSQLINLGETLQHPSAVWAKAWPTWSWIINQLSITYLPGFVQKEMVYYSLPSCSISSKVWFFWNMCQLPCPSGKPTITSSKSPVGPGIGSKSICTTPEAWQTAVATAQGLMKSHLVCGWPTPMDNG